MGGVAIEEGEIGSGIVARREMIERAARAAEIIERIGPVKGCFSGIGPHRLKRRRKPRNATPAWP